MNCKAAQHWMQLELDEELPEDDVAALADHLNGCPACTQVREQLWTLRSAMRELTEATGGGPDLDKPRAWEPAPRPRRFARVAGLAAAAIIAIIIGIWLVRPPASNGPAQPMIVERPAPSEASETAVMPPEPPEVRPQPRPLVRVEFDSPENVIAVPYETRNPNVTIIWLYPAMRGEQATGTPEEEPPAAEGASS